jgi:CRP-like cAMP-binding protein
MNVDKPEALRRSPLFEMLSPAELGALGDLSRSVRFAAGDVLITEGEAGASLYVLVSGEVDVLRREGGTEKVLATLAAPASLGEMSLIDREVRSATIRARTECVALQLTAENFASFRKRSRDGFTLFVINVARVLSARLRETNRKLASRL